MEIIVLGTLARAGRNMKYKLLFLIFHSCLLFVLNDRCCRTGETPRYKLIRRNGYSQQPIISRKIVNNLKKCEEFAASKKALAFNIGLSNEYNDDILTNHTNRRKTLEIICHALQCPETNNFTTFINDTNFNYYSMYPANVSLAGGSLFCIPKTGIYIFSGKNLNYTDAQNWCKKSKGFLANVISEERTNGLASIISHENPNFIGLSSRSNERIWRNEFGEPLSCFDYRAWGDGEPSNSRGCVGLIGKSSTNSSPFWKVFSCHIPLPFICELTRIHKKENLNV